MLSFTLKIPPTERFGVEGRLIYANETNMFTVCDAAIAMCYEDIPLCVVCNFHFCAMHVRIIIRT